jgi:hypothetical protein
VRHTYLMALVIVGALQVGASRADILAPLIVVDRWWGVDYAKADCFKEGKNEAVCDQERTQSYNVFELELMTQFAAAAECSGVTVTSFGYPQNQNRSSPSFAERPYWSFSINYFGDKRAQLWQMLPPKGSNLPMMQATGTPSEIARQVCAIINGKGGAIAQ